MPKTDYSKTIIYEFKCKDPLVKYSEIGATTNLHVLRHRFFKLKMDKKFPKLSQQITANGGIDNWEVEILEEYDLCTSKNDSNKRVKYWKKHKLELSDTIQKSKKINKNGTDLKTLPIDSFVCKYCYNTYSTSYNLKRHKLHCKDFIQQKDEAYKNYEEAKKIKEKIDNEFLNVLIHRNYKI